MKSVLFVLVAGVTMACNFAQAATPAELLAQYQLDSARATPGFTPSAQRGGAFYQNRFPANPRMPACTSCHTNDPAQTGRHVVTDKAIKPLAPAANPERFTDPAKVEKWFRRNCTEVVGRECTPAEKADFIAFLLKGNAK